MTSALNARDPMVPASLTTAYGVLFAINAVVASGRGVGTELDALTGALVLIVSAWIGVGLVGGARWARPAAYGLSTISLFFVLPVAGTILLGGPREPIGTGWDAVYFPATALVLIALLLVLWTSRGTASDPGTSAPEES